jgi:hypothetical protein
MLMVCACAVPATITDAAANAASRKVIIVPSLSKKPISLWISGN